MTTVWVLMALTCLLSIGAMAFSCSLNSSINSQVASVPAPVSQVQLESGETVNVVQNPTASPNFWAAKQCAQALILANFGIFGCSVSYIVLSYDCSIGHYFW